MTGRPQARRCFLALIEIDRFDGLKRTIGYAAAARLLAALADDVSARLPAIQLCRVGRTLLEASFAADSVETARDALAAVAAGVARRVTIDGFGFDLTVTIAFADAGGRPICDELVGVAERALAHARGSSLQIALADPIVPGATIDRLSLMRSLQQAIQGDQLALHYQPKVRARTGAVASVEALIRWTCPRAGPIPPDQFVPIAEETGDVRAMTDWVLDRAIADRATLAAGGQALRVDVNIPGCLLPDPGFARAMIARVAGAGGGIGFEITETSMIADPAGALAHLRLFAEAGIHLALDDYGSGFSSLAYLQQSPVNELKIDKAFVLRLATHQRDPLLVRSTIDLAHALEMEVTAEGVDSPYALALLQVMGCDLVQGYHLSRPLPLDRLERWLGDDAARAALVAPVSHRLLRRANCAPGDT